MRVHVERLPEVQVRHVIERKVPRPTSVTFQFHRPDGSIHRLMPMDLSYKGTFDILLPLGQILNDVSAPQLTMRAELHYDPRDRS